MRHHIPGFYAAAALALLLAVGVLLGIAVEPLTAQTGPTCAVLLDKTGAIAPMAGGVFAVTVFPEPATCNFQVSVLTPGRGEIGKGPANTANVTVSANPAGSAAREALFQIGDQVFRVVQAGETAVTPWDIGDVFVGAGSYAHTPGVYKTLAPQGAPKLDTRSTTPANAVADLLDGAGYFTNGCMVNPTVPNGDLFTAAWTANTLSIFDGETHQLRDVFRFTDPSTIHPDWGVGLNTPLAAIPYTTADPLPTEAIGTPDDPSTPGDDFIPPDIQGFEQVAFARNGEFYVGTQTPPDRERGLGHAYLLRFRYDRFAAARLTLTGWWLLDTGAIADRADGTSDGASGVDQFDLSSDQQTIFYTSEDGFIRYFNVVTGAAGAIELKNAEGQPLGVKAYGIRILPGPLDLDGNPTADGSAGFIVATSNNLDQNLIVRVDATGKTLTWYEVPGQPFAVNLTPDAQYFWTALTQDDPEDPDSEGGLYRFHIASGARERFEAGTTGVYGLCVKREYSAATADKRCPVLNDDGSYSLGKSACRTPPACNAVRLDSDGNHNPACFPPGLTRPVYDDRENREGDSPTLDIRRPGFVVDLTGLAQIPGLSITTDGVISGTIAAHACTPGPGDDPTLETRCTFTLTVRWRLESEPAAPSQESRFTWTIIHANAAPALRNPGTIALEPGETLPVFDPSLSCVGLFMAMVRCAATPIVMDPDLATDSVHVFTTGLPPGLVLPNYTSYGNGWHLPLRGTAPTTLGAEQGKFNVTITVCDDAGLMRNPAGVPIAPLACDPDSSHTSTESFFIHVATANSVPVCSAARATPSLIWPPTHKLVPFSIQNVTDPDGDPLTIVITSISQNQPVNDTGDGNTGFDATGVGTSSGAVRAERTGNLRVPGDGRVYDVSFTATDGKPGGTCAGTVQIGVPHDQRPRTLPEGNGCRWNSVTGQQLGPCGWLRPPAESRRNTLVRP